MRATLAIVVLLTAGSVFAADKTGFSWSNPTPDELLRPMTTDRPDATESPFTVDAGRIQIEISFAQHTYDRHNPERSDIRVSEWNVAPVNLRVGLTHDTELQIVVDNYLHVEERSSSGSWRQRQSGWGDVTLRLKRNLFGNDGGESALAVMPFVKIPTNSGGVGNNHFEGGLVVPASVTIGGRGFGIMTAMDLVHDGDDYTAVWLNTVTTGFELSDSLGAFVELASETGGGSHALTFNTGLTLGISENVQLDAGVNFGLTRAAPDIAVFAGISIRL
ncbi:MAG TPA: transporter [Opitutaceae bacterium]|nr:transporter [Opitutaceae bacterium]